MKIILTIAIIFSSLKIFAGGGHFHPKKVAVCLTRCTAGEIKRAVPNGIKEMVKWGK